MNRALIAVELDSNPFLTAWC